MITVRTVVMDSCIYNYIHVYYTLPDSFAALNQLSGWSSLKADRDTLGEGEWGTGEGKGRGGRGEGEGERGKGRGRRGEGERGRGIIAL